MIKNGKWFSEDDNKISSLAQVNSNNLAKALANTKEQQPQILYGGVSENQMQQMQQPQNSSLGNLLTGIGGMFSNNSKDDTLNGSVEQNEDQGGRNIGTLLGMGKSGMNAYQGFSGGSTPWGAISGFAKNGYNFISDKTPDDYSDVEQAVIYPLQGAATGASFGGPWGALGGALYGLGYSFKDDVGLDDDNFFTKLLFPIGMGDGGGFIDLG